MPETLEKITEPTAESAAPEITFHFRRLNADDIMPMCSIIGKIGLDEFISIFEKDGIKNLIASASGDEDVTIFGYSVVLEIVGKICSNIPKCSNEIYGLLASVAEMNVDDVRKMDFVAFTKMVIAFVKKEEFKDFIKVVSGLLK